MKNKMKEHLWYYLMLCSLMIIIFTVTIVDSQSCANKKESCASKPCCSGLECNKEAKVCVPLSQSSSCSADKTTVGQKVCNYDTNKNNVIDDPEILKAIDDWIKNRYPYLTDNEIIAILDMWIKQCDLSGFCVSGVTTTTTKPYTTTTTVKLSTTTITSKTTTTTLTSGKCSDVKGYCTWDKCKSDETDFGRMDCFSGWRCCAKVITTTITTTTIKPYGTTTTTVKPYATTTTIADNCYTAFTKTNKKACNYDFDNDGVIEDGAEINKALDDSSKGKLTSTELDAVVTLWKRQCNIASYCKGETNTCKEKFSYAQLYQKCPSDTTYRNYLKFAIRDYLSRENIFSLNEVKDLMSFYITENVEEEDCSSYGPYSESQIASLIGKAQLASGSLSADFECRRDGVISYTVPVGEIITCSALSSGNFCWEITSGPGTFLGSDKESLVVIKAVSAGEIKVKLTVCGSSGVSDTKEKTIIATSGEIGCRAFNSRDDCLDNIAGLDCAWCEKPKSGNYKCFSHASCRDYCSVACERKEKGCSFYTNCKECIDHSCGWCPSGIAKCKELADCNRECSGSCEYSTLKCPKDEEPKPTPKCKVGSCDKCIDLADTNHNNCYRCISAGCTYCKGGIPSGPRCMEPNSCGFLNCLGGTCEKNTANCPAPEKTANEKCNEMCISDGYLMGVCKNSCSYEEVEKNIGGACYWEGKGKCCCKLKQKGMQCRALLSDECVRGLNCNPTKAVFRKTHPDYKYACCPENTGWNGKECIKERISVGLYLPSPSPIFKSRKVTVQIDEGGDEGIDECYISWGDGTREEIFPEPDLRDISHEYNKDGVYMIVYACSYGNALLYNLSIAHAHEYVTVDTREVKIDNIFDIVYVPLNYNTNEYDKFKEDVEEAHNYFIQKSPFRELSEPWLRIKKYIINPKDCSERVGPNLCSTDVQNTIFSCVINSPYVNIADEIIGLVREGSSISTCGCSPIGGRISVAIYQYCGNSSPYLIVAHEMGHSFGLYHVEECGAEYGCWGPNARDCNEPDRKKFIMTYCPDADRYGPNAYKYLKEVKLKNYLS
ncbi:MAG: hypothetical protein QXY62_05305 [Candidatus Altiarchaeota archaeon]